MLALSLLLQLVSLVPCIKANHFPQSENHPAKRQSSLTHTSVPGFNISLPIDHFNKSDARVYNNQYWVNDTWYRPGGPIFLYHGGESGITPSILNAYLANDKSSVIALAKQYNGLVLCWEHRYFGGSLPFPLKPNPNSIAGNSEPIGAPASYKYLTVEQALEDVIYLANNLEKGGYQPDDLATLHPSKTPWVFIGGSYPAVLGNPEVIYATWASSAPVQAIYSGASYLSASARSLPSNCSVDIQGIVKHIDDVLAGPSTSQAYRDIQNLTYVSAIAASQGFNYTFNYSFVAQRYDPYTIASAMRSNILPYYQMYGPALVTHTFCNFLESYNPSVSGYAPNNTITSILSNPGNASPSPQGFLAQHNNNLTLGVYSYFYASLRNIQHIINDIPKVDVNTSNASANPAPFTRSTNLITFSEPELEDPADNIIVDNVSWQYLVATQFGWYQAYDPSYDTPGNHIYSRFVNVTSYQQYERKAIFDNATIAALPDRPDVNAFNRYGGWNMKPSNIMFTDGDSDPWRSGTVFSQETELGGPNRPTTTVVPTCGKPPPGNAVYGALYPGAAHVWDLHALTFIGANGTGLTQDGRTPQQVGMRLFTNALDVWLPCFNNATWS